MFLHAALLAACSALGQGDDTRLFQDLGEQFVSAIKERDIVEFSQCWISHRRLLAIANGPGVHLPDRARRQIADGKAYYLKRNRQVAHSFQILTDALARHGDLSQLRLTRIQGEISELGGLRHVSMFKLELKLADQSFQLRIDDGFYDAGSWYFADQPLEISHVGGEMISLRKAEAD